METPSELVVPRILGALALRRRVFADIAADRGAGPQAGLVVVISGVLEWTVDAAIHRGAELSAFEAGRFVLAALIGWILWSVVVWLVGTRAFGHDAEFAAVGRATALAHAVGFPYAVAAFAPLTDWAGLVRFVTLLWFLAALFVAIRGIFDIGARRATTVFGAALAARLALELVPEWLGLSF